MELEKRINNKCSNINPSCIKEKNINSVNLFDTSLKTNKSKCNEYSKAIKLKRNFK